MYCRPHPHELPVWNVVTHVGRWSSDGTLCTRHTGVCFSQKQTKMTDSHEEYGYKLTSSWFVFSLLFSPSLYYRVDGSTTTANITVHLPEKMEMKQMVEKDGSTTICSQVPLDPRDQWCPGSSGDGWPFLCMAFHAKSKKGKIEQWTWAVEFKFIIRIFCQGRVPGIQVPWDSHLTLSDPTTPIGRKLWAPSLGTVPSQTSLDAQLLRVRQI